MPEFKSQNSYAQFRREVEQQREGSRPSRGVGGLGRDRVLNGGLVVRTRDLGGLAVKANILQDKLADRHTIARVVHRIYFDRASRDRARRPDQHGKAKIGDAGLGFFGPPRNFSVTFADGLGERSVAVYHATSSECGRGHEAGAPAASIDDACALDPETGLP
jgi:hypothetical protein